MRTWFTIRAVSNTAEILIYDEIGAYGVTASEFDKQLKGLGRVSTITLRINSPGGDVFAASAIYSMVERHPARVVAYIDGVAASAASFIAMAAGEIVMPANALMMIHDPRGGALGTSSDMRDLADVLDKIATSMATAYAKKSGLSIEAVLKLMRAETWYTAAEAVAAGFADRIERPVKIAAQFDLTRYPKAPSAEAPKSMGELADAYWAGRASTPSPDRPAQQQVEGAASPNRASAVPDLVEAIDPVAIYARFNNPPRSS